jgi:transcriptional regulator with XRE-family HTH domain
MGLSLYRLLDGPPDGHVASVSVPPDLGDVIARNVRAERARRRWKQSDLAQRLGWTPANVGHLESGRRAVKAADLPALCEALDIPFEQLIFGADPEDVRRLRLS